MLTGLDLSDVLAFSSGIIAAWLAYWATRTKSRDEKEATLPTGWRDLTSEIKAWYALQLDHLENQVVMARSEIEARDGYVFYILGRIEELEEWADGADVEPPEVLSFREWRSRGAENTPTE